MATFTGTLGDDYFQGTIAADDFYFNFSTLKLLDFVGGGGSQLTDPKDRLFWSGPEELNFNAFSYQVEGPGTLDNYNKIMGIEQLYLSASGTAVQLSTPSLNSSASGSFEIFGTGSGKDFIYANDYFGVPRTVNLIVHAGDGNDTIQNLQNYGFPAIQPAIQGDQLYGEGGDDLLIGYGSLYGGDGNDSISVWGTNSRAYGGNGNDNFFGGAADGTTLDGGDGSDYITISSYLSTSFTFSNITSIASIYLKSFDGNISQLNALKQFNPLMWTYGTTSIVISGPGATIDLRTIAIGAFDAAVTFGSSYNSNDPIENYTLIGTSGHNTITGGNRWKRQ